MLINSNSTLCLVPEMPPSKCLIDRSRIANALIWLSYSVSPIPTSCCLHHRKMSQSTRTQISKYEKHKKLSSILPFVFTNKYLELSYDICDDNPGFHRITHHLLSFTSFKNETTMRVIFWEGGLGNRRLPSREFNCDGRVRPRNLEGQSTTMVIDRPSPRDRSVCQSTLVLTLNPTLLLVD